MDSDTSNIKNLIDEIIVAKQKYEILKFDEEYVPKLGEAASTGHIKKLEAILGKPLPPSYKAFLELYNGWEEFHGDGKLLSTEDHESNWVKDKIQFWSGLWEKENPSKNPFEQGAIPVMLGESLNHFIVLDPNREGPNGKLDFVEFDYMCEESTYEDFTAYLQEELEILQILIDREMNGVLDDSE